MKKIIKLSIILTLISSCSTDRQVNDLKEEIEQLKSKNQRLEQQLENSIVIKQDELSDYIMPVTFGQFVTDVNTESIFETHLVLKKLPNNVKYEWTCSPEAMSVKNEDLVHYVKNAYPSKRKVEFFGSYDLTFKNGMKKKFPWLGEFEVK